MRTIDQRKTLIFIVHYILLSQVLSICLDFANKTKLLSSNRIFLYRSTDLVSMRILVVYFYQASSLVLTFFSPYFPDQFLPGIHVLFVTRFQNLKHFFMCVSCIYRENVGNVDTCREQRDGRRNDRVDFFLHGGEKSRGDGLGRIRSGHFDKS